MPRHVAIIGSSLAGTSAALAARDTGFDGRITLIDRSPDLPSDHPPLSKSVLTGDLAGTAAVMPTARRLEAAEVDLSLGTNVASLVVGEHRLRLDDGKELLVDGVVVATGAAPRRVPESAGGALEGVHSLRTLDDALALRDRLDGPERAVVVIGAGFIGLEVAASCRTLGHRVTLLEAGVTPMQRVFPRLIGGVLEDLHRHHGVDVRTAAEVVAIEGDGRAERVRLADDTTVECDLVVVGLGVTPSVGALRGTGLDIGDGLLCDATLLAAPGITAAGDVARWFNPRYGVRMRVEHWQNAIEQGEHAARRLLAGTHAADDPEWAFASVPWFWSDQYDRKIQFAGVVSTMDEAVVVEGSVQGTEESGARLVVLFRRGAECVGVFGVNRPRAVITARTRLVQGPLAFEDAVVAFGRQPL